MKLCNEAVLGARVLVIAVTLIKPNLEVAASSEQI